MTDGNVAYVSEEHGHPTLYVREPGGHAKPIDPSLEVSSHIVSPDGERLLFTDRRGWVRQWTEKDGLGKPFLKVETGSEFLGMGRDGQTLLFSKESSTSFEVYSHDLVNQQTGLLFKDHNRRDGPQFCATLTPSGENLIVTRDHCVTSINLAEETVSLDVLPTRLYGYEEAPRLLTALDDRFLLFGEENWVPVDDFDPETLDDDFDTSDLQSNDDGRYYDNDSYPITVPHLQFSIFDLKEQKIIESSFYPRLGNIVKSGGEIPEKSAFEQEFPETKQETNELWNMVEKLANGPRKDITKISNPDW